LQTKFYNSTLLTEVTNTKYEGEIRGQGSKIIIRVRPTITIGDYETGGTLNYQDLADDKLEMVIDKAKYYAFKVDDIDKAQSDIAIVNEATTDAARQMRITIEKELFGAVYPDATTVFAPTVIDPTSVLQWIVDAGVAMDELNNPEEGRFVIMPPWICGMIKKSELKDASLAGDASSILRKGLVGMIDRFKIYMSNNLTLTGDPATGTYECMAGHKEAISFASQYAKTETIRLQDSFGDSIRGLKVHGFKTILPDALVHMPATRA
jgi:hypothetical protein